MDKKELEELSAMMRLAEVMNDSERTITLGGKEYKIKALRAGTQWLVAEEACKIAKAGESFTDIIKQFATNIQSVVRVLTLIILNDKDKINGEEYQALYDTIMWEVPREEWITVLVECLQMLDLQGFFQLTGAIENFRTMTLTKRTQEAS